MIGDQLARGGKRAVFYPPRPELKNVSEPSGADLDRVTDSTSESHLPHLVDNSAPVKPRVLFKGKPRGDMVLVVRVEQESSSLLVVPDVAKGKSEIGRVAGVGIKVTDIHIGDLVMFDRFASVGNEVKLVTEDGEKEHLMLREYDVMLTLEEIRSEVS